jgi:hypothetical protein
MANSVINVRDAVTGLNIPFKAYDNGDGTYTCDGAVLKLLNLLEVETWQTPLFTLETP